MLTGVIHRTGVALALLSDRAQLPLAVSMAHPISSLSPSLPCMMRLRPFGLLLSGVVASSACSMDATAPPTLGPSAAVARASETRSPGGRSDANNPFQPATAGALEVTSTYVVTVYPQRPNVLRFGPFTVDLPANAICDQGSGYGLDVFDLDCKAEKNSVRITALVRSMAGGAPRIDFMPEMRFSPKRVVTLVQSMADAPMPASSPRLLYCATVLQTACVDEAALDPTLVTEVDVASRTVFRRIKHFSGYFVEW